MTPAFARQGTILLWCLAFSAFLTTIAFAFVRTAHQHVESTSGSIVSLLARQAANTGTSHAIAVICDDYTRSPTIPSHRFSPWMTAFQPFDLRLDNLTDYAIDYPGDLNGDDTKAVNPLIMPYATLSSRGRHDKWEAGFTQQGDRTHSGYGRYLEPGQHGSSQFYAGAGVAGADERRFDAAPGSTAYPEAALWFDQRWRPVRSRGEAAYRLRYATMVEDISGHLLWNPGQTAYPAAFPAGYAPASSGAGGIDESRHEYDFPLAQRYAPAFYNLGEIAGRSISKEVTAYSVDTYGTLAHSPQWMLSFRGLGSGSSASDAGPSGSSSTAGRSRFIWRYNQATSQADAVAYDRKYPWYLAAADTTLHPGSPTFGTRGNTGAMFSWAQLAGHTGSGGGNAVLQGQGQHAMWVWTPFGSRVRNLGRVAARPEVDCPWQVNPLTAPPRVLAAMIAGLVRSNLKKLDLTKEVLQEDNQFGTGNPANWSNLAAPGAQTLSANFPSLSFRGADLFVDTFTYADKLRRPFEFPEKTVDAASNIANVGYSGTAVSNKLGRPMTPYDYYPGPAWWRGAYLDAEAGSALAANRYPEGASTAKAEDELGREFSPMAGTSIPLIPPLGGELTGPIDSCIHSTNSATANGLAPAARYRVRWYNAVPGFENSLWADILVAMGHTLAVTRATWNPSCTVPADAAAVLALMDANGSGRIDTPEEMDRLFLAQLGADFAEVVAGTPTAAVPTALYVDKSSIADHGTIKTWKARTNLESLAAAGRPELTAGEGIKPDLYLRVASSPITRHVARGLMIEKVINDVRMSFFGASPGYSGFKAARLFASGRPGDGSTYEVDPAGYPLFTLTAPADLAVASGLRNQSRQCSYAVDANGSPAAADHFSLTGYFAFGKSHFYRLITRGEVFSVLRNLPIEETNLETVVVVDPDGDGNLGDSHVIYQNWLHNGNKAFRPSVVTP